MAKQIADSDLVVHMLNVGFGDTIVVEFPTDTHGTRAVGIVDCRNSSKTLGYLDKLSGIRPFNEVAFVCATHPHYDHISGITALLTSIAPRPTEFWDSGFRHQSTTYKKILETVRDQNIAMKRVSSGMEWYFGNVRVTALSPSVALRNRYATYGVDMNNASIVLRLEHCEQDAVTIQSLRYEGTRDPDRERSAGAAVVILGGDAEFDSWARITQEYPFIESTSAHKPLVKKMVNLLQCSLVKVAHHGSMHSSPLDVYERMSPATAVVSNKQQVSTKTVGGATLTRNLFPHDTAVLALKEVGANILTTDAPHRGTIVAVVPPGKKPRIKQLQDGVDAIPTPPQIV